MTTMLKNNLAEIKNKLDNEYKKRSGRQKEITEQARDLIEDFLGGIYDKEETFEAYKRLREGTSTLLFRFRYLQTLLTEAEITMHLYLKKINNKQQDQEEHDNKAH